VAAIRASDACRAASAVSTAAAAPARRAPRTDSARAAAVCRSAAAVVAARASSSVAGDGADVGTCGDGGAGGGQVLDDDVAGQRGAHGAQDALGSLDELRQPAGPGRGVAGRAVGIPRHREHGAAGLVGPQPGQHPRRVGERVDDHGVGAVAESGGHGRFVPGRDAQQ
jgi:hypothetical protein